MEPVPKSERLDGDADGGPGLDGDGDGDGDAGLEGGADGGPVTGSVDTGPPHAISSDVSATAAAAGTPCKAKRNAPSLEKHLPYCDDTFACVPSIALYCERRATRRDRTFKRYIAKRKNFKCSAENGASIATSD